MVLWEELRNMLEVTQPKFQRNSHNSEESELAFIPPTLDGSFVGYGTVTSREMESSDDGSLSIHCPSSDESTRNERHSLDSNDGEYRDRRMKPTSNSEEATGVSVQECKRYFFLDDEYSLILDLSERVKEVLLRLGLNTTVDEIAPIVYHYLYVSGSTHHNPRVNRVRRLIEIATKNNPYRKVADVNVVRTAINNRTHYK